MRPLVLFITLFWLGAGPLYAQEEEPDLGTEAQRTAGRQLYLQRCSQCHGESGAGDGIAAQRLKPQPRDFTRGIFKFRSTPSGALPTDADLRRSIREGMPYTSMPAWPELSEEQVTNLIYFIKTLNEDFAGPYGTPEPIEIPEPPSFSEASARRGREVYLRNQCFDCHGQFGRGDGSSAPTLETPQGNHIRPADLTKRWTFRNGQTRQDIYRTFTTGLDGTPMPSYDIPEEDQWALVDYVWSLSRSEPNYATVVVAKRVEGALDIRRGQALFEEAAPAYFPVVGQVIEPGRAFHPATNGIEVKVLYNEEEIAFMLTWHTMSADTTGRNSPTLSVPRFEERADTIGAGYAATRDTTTAFSDAVALQFPSENLEGVIKPYFLFGDAQHAVDIWFADLAQDSARVFVGHGSERIEPAEDTLAFYSGYHDGEWTAIFKQQRSREEELSFEVGSFVPLAFSVWDGFNEERGAKRGITSWYHVYLEPVEQRSAAIPMAAYGLVILLLELGLVYVVRTKYKKRAPA